MCAKDRLVAAWIQRLSRASGIEPQDFVQAVACVASCIGHFSLTNWSRPPRAVNGRWWMRRGVLAAVQAAHCTRRLVEWPIDEGG